MSNPNYAPNPTPPSNGLGVAGFIVSLVGFVLGLVLCPIGLLMSLIALRKAPRGFAIAGTIIGLLGTLILAVIFLFFGAVIVACMSLISPHLATDEAIKDANRRVEQYESTHGGALPSDLEAQDIVGGEVDGWKHGLRYRQVGNQYEIRSAGPDGIMDTPDDEAQTFMQMPAVER